MAVGKKLRFEVFKRDKFTCQYCGKRAPDVVLHVDHIEPLSKGGGDELLNLITACADCNLGKGARELSDETAVAKKQAQLDALQERRDQLAAMLEWEKELLQIDEEHVNMVADFWTELAPGVHLNERGISGLRETLRKHGTQNVIEAMKDAAASLTRGEDGDVEIDAAQVAWGKVAKFASVHAARDKEPFLRQALYIRGIVRNRCGYCNQRQALNIILAALNSGYDEGLVRQIACDHDVWTRWREAMEDLTSED